MKQAAGFVAVDPAHLARDPLMRQAHHHLLARSEWGPASQFEARAGQIGEHCLHEPSLGELQENRHPDHDPPGAADMLASIYPLVHLLGGAF